MPEFILDFININNRWTNSKIAPKMFTNKSIITIFYFIENLSNKMKSIFISLIYINIFDNFNN